MADWFDLTRCEHAFGLGEPRLLVYRHQRPDAEEEPVTMPSTNIPVQAAPAWSDDQARRRCRLDQRYCGSRARRCRWSLMRLRYSQPTAASNLSSVMAARLLPSTRRSAAL